MASSNLSISPSRALTAVPEFDENAVSPLSSASPTIESFHIGSLDRQVQYQTYQRVPSHVAAEDRVSTDCGSRSSRSAATPALGSVEADIADEQDAAPQQQQQQQQQQNGGGPDAPSDDNNSITNTTNDKRFSVPLRVPVGSKSSPPPSSRSSSVLSNHHHHHQQERQTSPQPRRSDAGAARSRHGRTISWPLSSGEPPVPQHKGRLSRAPPFLGRIRDALVPGRSRKRQVASLPRGRAVYPEAHALRQSHMPQQQEQQQQQPPLEDDEPPSLRSGSDNKQPGVGVSSSGLDDVEADAGDDSCDDEVFKRKFAEPPTYCWSREDILKKRNSWISVIILALSVYSTVMSALWMVVAFVQPRWGHKISSRGGGVIPSTATLVTALVAKTIELSFVTVFISCVGQVLTRRAIARRSTGVTLAEMTMRNWVIQPGYLITHFETIPYAGLTVLGALSLTATIAAMFYTTASDAMVAPKLKFGAWEAVELQGRVRSSYANAAYVKEVCPSLFDTVADPNAQESCLNVQFSGQSFRNLLSFMTEWTAISDNGTSRVVGTVGRRPAGTTLLYDNTTMSSAWIQTDSSDVAAQAKAHGGRIINNVTLAMPHPGVYTAARDPVNGILQPDDLAGVGEYAIRAGVVSPAINVMCVNMDQDELKPLVYIDWPQAQTMKLQDVGVQDVRWKQWSSDVPTWFDADGKKDYLNQTVVDDIFRWGPKYDRIPPVFQLYPKDYNTVTNSTGAPGATAFYVLAKSPLMTNYTLCEMRSFVSPACSTHFNISGTAGASMQAHCEDPNDMDAYHWTPEKSPDFKGEWPTASLDWKWIAAQWGLSMALNGGVTYSNASSARILTQLALQHPTLPPIQPSIAEALAVYASSTLLISSIDTPFRHYWDYNKHILGAPGAPDSFHSSVITQQYTSGHINSWQRIFYVVLVIIFIINVCCLVLVLLRAEQVTDYTEPQNLFALAINSPPSAQLKGSCGGGPQQRDLVVPWRVEYAKNSNHYFFEEANERPWRGKYAVEGLSTARDYVAIKGNSYKRLSSSRGWL
ncbi:hypothetical protein JDV02_002021 [Purpureocillium takamizusanense]|uniref:Mcm2 3 5 family protein n=1 Tax=Purpureocillium takamizusanense TaxID=2060973 RepID=A0A9Q8QA28_9HYPO|nr:uncharacterized protein JDV02_002021 [Purpureocillium takamizusanense]UNI15492.1 hypothetical protein JDV02_002021 [Purpureocillium takamizusanense]